MKMMKNEEEEEDRTIITFDERNSYTIILNRRLSLAIAVVTRAVLPTVVNIYYSFLRNQQLLVDNLCNQLLPSFLAFVANTISNSLSSVQRGITNPISRKTNVGEDSTTIDGESSSPTNAPEKSVDLIILSQPQGKIEADIIFIHGLHGGMGRTWTQRQWRQENQKPNEQSPTSGSNSNVKKSPSWKCTKCNTCGICEEPLQGHCTNCIDNQEWKIVDYEKNVEFEYYSDCWPRDWITLDCPSVRVIALNYDTDVLWCPMWLRKRIRTGMVERSEEMIEELIKVGVGKQPIIWVGHSKGGLYIKQIILNAVEKNFDNKEEIRNIKEQTKAIMFYSVPHKGSLLADVTLPFLRRSIELLEVQRNCDFVLDLDRRFINLCNQGDFSPEILSFIETAFTLMSFIFLKIVAYDSADIGIGTKYGVPFDHREICKPSSRDCFLYVELIKLIKRIISDQPVQV